MKLLIWTLSLRSRGKDSLGLLSIKAEFIDDKNISEGIKGRKRGKNCKSLKEDTRRIAGVRP